MNRSQISRAIDQARRAQLKAQGRFDVVDRDDHESELAKVRRDCRRKLTNVARTKRRAQAKALEAQQALKAERRKVRQLERRVEDLEIALRFAQDGRRHLRAVS